MARYGIITDKRATKMSSLSPTKATKEDNMSLSRTCSIKNCTRPFLAKGMCGLHYTRAKFDPTRSSWRAMKRRCTDRNFIYYPKYGGRGIGYCKRWESFELFLQDMGERPADHTLDRIDNDADYSPENCRWATKIVQNQNQNRRKDNTSGYPGVNWHIREKKWIARVQADGKRICVGRFDNIYDATRAVRIAKSKARRLIEVKYA